MRRTHHHRRKPIAISFRGVKKVYHTDGKVAALNGVSIDVEKEGFLVIMGRSGFH